MTTGTAKKAPRTGGGRGKDSTVTIKGVEVPVVGWTSDGLPLIRPLSKPTTMSVRQIREAVRTVREKRKAETEAGKS